MPTVLTERTIADTLPGDWHVGATNLPLWLDGERHAVSFRFERESSDPLVIREQQDFTTTDGKAKVVVRVSRWQRGEFQVRASRLLGARSGRWSVIGVNGAGSVVVLKVEKSRGVQEGLLVLVRLGFDASELRSMVAASSGDFGLGPEDFGSLSWLEVAARG